MQTLELRESKSSLAGLLLAAAAEGVGAYELFNHVGPFLHGDAAEAARHALTLSRLRGLKGSLARTSGESADAAGVVGSLPGAPGGAPAEGGVAGGLAADPSPGAAAAPAAQAADVAAAPAPVPGGDPASAPVDAGPQAGGGWPTADSADPDLLGVAAPRGDAAAAAADHLDAAATAGAGSGAGAAAQAVLDNPHITLPPNTRHDLESGVVDPRLVATLEKLAEHHDIAISVIKTGHPEFVAGSHSVSNHYYGRALDIASVDGRAVNAGNPAAREVATEIAALDPAIRPSEVGTPWPIGAPGFFSDAEHQNHLHIGFDDPPPAGLKLPGTEPAVQSHAAGVADQLGAPGAVVTKGQKAVEMAKHFLGTPYRWGGASPQTGFDCSGLMQYVYGRLGIHMPRVAEDQFHFGMRVGRGQLQPGDLVFFQDPTGYIHHVGMYVGGGKFIHAPHTGDVIKISSLDEPYYRQQFAGGSRAAPHEAVAATAQAPASPDAAPEEAPVAHAVRDTAAFEALAKQEASWHRHTAQFLHAVEERPAWAREAAHHGPAFDLSDAPGNYPGDDAAKTEIARWMAAAAEKAGLPPELPVMAALVESNLHNVNYGDRDSLGYFQMRTGTWNSGDYQGFPDHPELQLKWFIDHALAVKRQWIARGRAADLADPSKHGEWVADVEQPAAEYRFRYQLRLGQARGLLRG